MKAIEIVWKLERVINSCETPAHYSVARRMALNYERMFFEVGKNRYRAGIYSPYDEIWQNLVRRIDLENPRAPGDE